MSNDTSHKDGILSYAVIGLGLVIALAGLANVLPTYGVLPRIGPFPVEWFRPLFFWLCVIIFIVSYNFV